MVLVYMYILYETANAWIMTKFYFMYFFFFLTFFLYIYDGDIKRKETWWSKFYQKKNSK